jgi:hypothetical protein
VNDDDDEVGEVLVDEDDDEVEAKGRVGIKFLNLDN